MANHKDEEVDLILGMPEEQQAELIDRMGAACDKLEVAIEEMNKDPRLARLTAQKDQLQAKLRDHPEIILDVAIAVGLSEAELREWLEL